MNSYAAQICFLELYFCSDGHLCGEGSPTLVVASSGQCDGPVSWAPGVCWTGPYGHKFFGEAFAFAYLKMFKEVLEEIDSAKPEGVHGACL